MFAVQSLAAPRSRHPTLGLDRGTTTKGVSVNYATLRFFLDRLTVVVEHLLKKHGDGGSRSQRLPASLVQVER